MRPPPGAAPRRRGPVRPAPRRARRNAMGQTTRLPSNPCSYNVLGCLFGGPHLHARSPATPPLTDRRPPSRGLPPLPRALRRRAASGPKQPRVLPERLRLVSPEIRIRRSILRAPPRPDERTPSDLSEPRNLGPFRSSPFARPVRGARRPARWPPWDLSESRNRGRFRASPKPLHVRAPLRPTQPPGGDLSETRSCCRRRTVLSAGATHLHRRPAKPASGDLS